MDREGTGYPMAEQKAKGHEFEILRPGCSQDGEGIPEVAYEHYLTALLAGDRRFCQATVETLLDQRVPIRRIYEELFGRSLYRVGELWERGRISVAKEHLATALTESLMTLVYPQLFAAPHTRHSAVVSCVAHEYHHIGGKMVADTFEFHGWNSYFLGANTPIKDLLSLIDEKQPEIIALSMTITFHLESLIRTLTSIRHRFPNTPIWIGGQAFRWGGAERVEEIHGTAVLSNLAEMETRLRDWGT